MSHSAARQTGRLFVELAARSTFLVAKAIEKRRPILAIELLGRVRHWTARSASLGGQRLNAAATVSESVLVSSRDLERSLALNEQVIAAYGEANDEELQVHVAWAMVNNGWGLAEADRLTDASQIYRIIHERLSRKAPFIEPIAQGLTNYGHVLDMLGRHEEAVSVYDEIIQLLQGVEGCATLRFLVWSFIHKGIALTQEGRWLDAVAMYEVVLNRWWDAPIAKSNQVVEEGVAAAARYRAGALAALGNFAAAIDQVDGLEARCLGSDYPGTQEEVSMAMITKGGALEALGRRADALLAYNRVVDAFSPASSDDVNQAVLSAKRLREGLEAE